MFFRLISRRARPKARKQATPTRTLTEIVQLIEQAARALQHAHDHHILHLDVKYSDPLTAGNVHDTTWTTDGTYCFFASDGYHVHVDTSQATSPHFCTESDRPYQDAAITIAMSIRGGYSGGLLLRLQNSRGYFFEVGIGGNYHIGNWGAPGSLQDWTDSPAIKQGLNSLNTLQVIAHGSDFLFYVNGVYLTQVQDATYGVGDIGFACEANNTTGPGQAVFSNLNVYL